MWNNFLLQSTSENNSLENGTQAKGFFSFSICYEFHWIYDMKKVCWEMELTGNKGLRESRGELGTREDSIAHAVPWSANASRWSEPLSGKLGQNIVEEVLFDISNVSSTILYSFSFIFRLRFSRWRCFLHCCRNAWHNSTPSRPHESLVFGQGNGRRWCKRDSGPRGPH